MRYPKRTQYKYAKARYRVRNWNEYEAGLLDPISGPLASVAAHGADDAGAIYEAAHGKGNGTRVQVLIPPGRGEGGMRTHLRVRAMHQRRS